MPSKVWDEITYPFLNFNGPLKFSGGISNFTPQFKLDLIIHAGIKVKPC